MSIFNENKKILQQQYGGLLEELYKGDDSPPENIKIETTPTGEPTLNINGIYIHSQRDPLREAQRLAESAAAEKGAIVLLGFGLGYAAEAAVKTGRPVIIVEKHKCLLLKAFELRDFTNFLSKNRIMFIVGGTGEGITNALGIANDLLSEKNEEKKRLTPFVIRNKALINLDEQWYRAVDDRIRAWTMKDEVNTATHKRFGQRWARNISRNMSVIRDCPGISHLSGLADNSLPVFLAAAGPSLDKIKPLLREIHDRCIIVAVDTSLRFFVQNGIQPDFVVVVDPQFWNSRHLDRCIPCDLKNASFKTALIAEPAVYPPVLSLPFKNKFICSSMFALGAFVESRVCQKGKLGAGGSVATTAWDFARILGATEIWIAGLDLAFPGLKTHFKGARFESLSNSQSARLNPVEKWVVRALRDGIPFNARSATGGLVLTDKRLSLYAAWFENQFRQNKQVLNFALFQEGLAIEGLQAADTEKFLTLPKRREEIDNRIKAVFSQTENTFNNPEEKQKRHDRYEKAVFELKNGFENIRNDSAKGAEIARQALESSLTPSEQEKIYKELDELKKRVTESEVKEAADFLLPLVEEKTEDMPMNDNDPFNSYLKSSLELFSGIAKTAEFYLYDSAKISENPRKSADQ